MNGMSVRRWLGAHDTRRKRLAQVTTAQICSRAVQHDENTDNTQNFQVQLPLARYLPLFDRCYYYLLIK